MRKIFPDKLEAGRMREGHWRSAPGSPYGAFDVMGPSGRELRIIASDGADEVSKGWEHVSVSTKASSHPPNWREMCFVKDLFWNPDECVLQFHPPEQSYVNNFSTCLHLWKSPVPIDMPPEILVGVKKLGTLA